MLMFILLFFCLVQDYSLYLDWFFFDFLRRFDNIFIYYYRSCYGDFKIY